MALVYFSWIDYAIFTIITALGCLIGIYFGFYKKQDNVQNYLNGGKNLKWFPVCMSLVSSAFTGFSLLGYPTEVYMYGTQISVLVLSVFFCGLISYFIFLPVFFKLQISSIYEYLQLRYNSFLKNTFSIFFIISTIFLLPILMYIPSLIFSQVSGVKLHVIAPIMILICIFYTVIGGLKAVIWADTLQFAVTVVTLAIVITLGVISTGGFDVVYERVRAGDRWEFFNFSFDPTVRTTFWTVVVGHTISWTGMVSIAAPEIQRYLTLSSMKNIKKTLITFTGVTVAAKSVCFLLGMIIYAKYYDCDPKSIGEIKKPDQIVPYFITEVTQGLRGLNGLFVAAFFGAAFSSYSTILNTCASVIYTDFLQLRITNKLQEKQGLVLKLLTFGIGILSIAMIYIVENFGTIFELAHYIKGITGGATLGIFLLGLMVPQANAKGAIAGGVTSIILMGIIIIGTQIYVWNGVIQENPKPLYTYGCNFTNNSSSISSTISPLSTTWTIQDNQTEPMWLFRISFQYYFLIGTMATVFVGIIVSWFTRKETDGALNPDYFSPFIYKLSETLRKRKIEFQEETVSLKKQNGSNK
ncbi:hypothetical protein FQR65_LT00347 [Abscondita terminalis]|nr:hypothetical protein FQR65_LT00347 [Abscondita terminalis]